MARIIGTAANDTLNGTIVNDVIQGLAGNDSLYGLGGNDTLDGGDGSDFMDGGDGDDILYGGNGNDFFADGVGNNLIYGGDGDDYVSIYGFNPSSNNLLDGGAGSDRLNLDFLSSPEAVTVTFTNGTFALPGITATNFESLGFSGGDGNDVVYGGDGNDDLAGQAGNDLLSGGNGNDSLFGADGDDVLLGGAGDDYLDDWHGRNVLDGGSGNDFFYIRLEGSSNTVVTGGTGIDQLTLSAYSIEQGLTIDLTNGSISLPNLLTATSIEGLTFNGDSYNDTVTGGRIGDSLSGEDGDDILSGKNGADQLYGGLGNDIVDGGNGVDQLYGDDPSPFGLGGNDILIGDLGADQMTGGFGADQFKFAAASGSNRFVAGRAILDFSQAEADKIVLGKTMFPALQSAVGNGFSVSSEFATVRSAAAAAASNALIAYNINTGILYYNANGAATGFGSGGQFVTLTTKPVLSTSDFVIQ